MKCDRSNRLKCPMCMEYIFQQDLKSVRFDEGVVVGNTSLPTEKPKLILNKSYTFQHLVIHAGRIAPHIYTPSINISDATTDSRDRRGKKQINDLKTFSGQLNALAKVIPEESSLQATFARISFRNVSKIRENFSFDKKELLLLRQQTVLESGPALDEAGVYCLNVIDDALEYLTQEETKFENKVSEFLLDVVDFITPSISMDNAMPENVFKKGENAGKKTQNKTGISSTKGWKESSRQIEWSPSDLPTCEEEEEIQLAIALMESMNCEDSTASKLTSTSTNNSKLSPSKENSFVTNLFQCSSGLPVYLHPLCTRCFLEQSIVDQGERSRNSILYPQRLSGKVIDIERVQLGDNDTSKYKFLKFLPKYTEAYIVELEMKPLVSPQVINMFKEDFAKRKAKRIEKQKQLDRERKLDEKAR